MILHDDKYIENLKPTTSGIFLFSTLFHHLVHHMEVVYSREALVKSSLPSWFVFIQYSCSSSCNDLSEYSRTIMASFQLIGFSLWSTHWIKYFFACSFNQVKFYIVWARCVSIHWCFGCMLNLQGFGLWHLCHFLCLKLQFHFSLCS